MQLRPVFLFLCAAVLAAGCQDVVLKQQIPVSSDPIGAMVYADGRQVGATPTTVELERNRDHIITLTKSDYQQLDVNVMRKYQQEKVLMGAIQEGLNSGLFFGKAEMGIQRGISSISMKEKTGEAYILTPPTVMAKLAPLNDPAGSRSMVMPMQDAQSMGGTPVSSGTASSQPDYKGIAKDALMIGAAAGAAAIGPVEKNVHSSSSSKSYVKSDGTMVREKTSSSVSVGFNPAGVLPLIDKLFQ